MSDSRLIVGLGNPGKEYENTRHNLGFLVVEKLAERLNFKFRASSFTKAFIAKGQGEEQDVALFLPTTYMNNSGIALKTYLREKEIPLENVLVVCDDLNLPFGQMRIRPKGTDGGHNGLVSIIEQLDTDEFPRLRLGIDHPRKKEEVVKYVLQKFNKQELDQLNNFIEEAADCCLLWLKHGIKKAMERHNNRRKEDGKNGI